MVLRVIRTADSDAEVAAALHAVLSEPVDGEVSVFRQQVLDVLGTNAGLLFAYKNGEPTDG